VLAILGYYFNSQKDLFLLYYKEIAYILIGVGAVAILYLFLRKK